MVFRCLIICGLIFSQNLYAVETKELFEAEVVTKSQSREDRNDAIKQALKQVLGRLLAGENVLETPAVRTILNNAGHYTLQFQYSLIDNAGAKDSNARVMRVLFDEQALLALLKDSDLGVWTEVRPETLLWLVVEENGKRRFFKAINMPDVDNAVSKASKRKALPLLFPLLDLEEQQLISVNDVLGAYPDRMLQVSSRYDVRATLVGRLVKKNNCWLGEWALYFDNGIKQWSSSCTSLDNAALSGLQGTYDKLSVYYGVKPDIAEQGSLTLKVSGIESMEQMNQVTQYLESLKMITSVNWDSVKAGFNIYKISYSGDRKVLENLLLNSGVLQTQAEDKRLADVWVFQLNKKGTVELNSPEKVIKVKTN